MSDWDDFEDEGPSKSELKRQVRALQDLGDELVALPPAELDALELPDDLRDAVIEGRRITAHGARVRQRLYIGKLLRRIDVEPIRAALASRAETDRQRIRREHAIEQWRERLLADIRRRAFTADGQTVVPSVSIGVAAYPDCEALDASRMLEQADAALYAVKNSGAKGFVVAACPGSAMHPGP